MRILQAVIFILGVLSFLAAAFFMGQDSGDTFWRVGVGLMLIDLAYMKLWPSVKPT